jgi:small-conductance mechanosensitive channel
MIPGNEEITGLITPFISAMIALVVSLWIRDTAGRIAKGLAFKFNGQFKEGDEVVLDGERALIVKIGMTSTVFGIYRATKNGNGINHYWRYVPNERIPYLHLEKIVSDKEDIEGSE